MNQGQFCRKLCFKPECQMERPQHERDGNYTARVRNSSRPSDSNAGPPQAARTRLVAAHA